MAVLEVRSLSRSYPDEVWALRDASFTVPEGHIAAILGPSGCGKTTLLRLVAGLDRPDGGDVVVNGESILALTPDRRGIGLMFQDLALFPHMDVRANVEFGLRMHDWPKDARRTRVDELLAAVGLAGKAARKVHELSGGEQQRVALARTLAPQPRVLLLDEPLGSLDEVLKQSLRHELRDVLKRLETTAVIVSHDLRDAVAMADDLIVMEEGRVLQAGPLARVLSGPSSIRVAEMLGYVTLVRGEVVNERLVEPEVGSIAFPHGFPLEDGARAMAHPSSLLGVPLEAGLGCGVTGVVQRIRAHGPMFLLDLAVDDRVVEVRWEWDLVPPPLGTRVEVAVRPGTLRFFNPRISPLPAPRPQAPTASKEPAPADEAKATAARHEGGEPPSDDAPEGSNGDEAAAESSTEPDVEPPMDVSAPGASETPEEPILPPRRRETLDEAIRRRAGIAPELGALLARRHTGMPLD